MWSERHRKRYARVVRHCPSDVTDDTWAGLELAIPSAKPGGRPRRASMREAVNAIFYLLRTGCVWRYFRATDFRRVRR